MVAECTLGGERHLGEDLGSERKAEEGGHTVTTSVLCSLVPRPVQKIRTGLRYFERARTWLMCSDDIPSTRNVDTSNKGGCIQVMVGT